jgi:Fe-S cluster biogenesis protein NfuA/nitrite reductase/ring-hydroxylating ferredoxin subunit
MAHPEPRRPAVSEEFEPDARWRASGDRIQTLLDALATGGPVVRGRAEELVRELTDLYGAGMHRMMAMAAVSSPDLLEQFAADDLVASLMLVHGLHPHTVQRRIEDALDGVRPYLGSHGGDVHLLDVADDVVILELAGNCKSCPSSAVTLELTVEDAVRAAAPEISTIRVVASEPKAASSLIAADSLMSRVHTRGNPAAAWHAIPDIEDLASGEVGGFLVAGVPVLACRIGDDLFVYRDRCGNCTESLAGAALHRRMGSAAPGGRSAATRGVGPGEAVLRCPRCHAHFDAVHAGVGMDETAGEGVHLDPVPLLIRDGVLSVAVLAEATGVS